MCVKKMANVCVQLVKKVTLKMTTSLPLNDLPNASGSEVMDLVIKTKDGVQQ